MMIRLWILERARDYGSVSTCEVARRFGLSTKNAARHLTHLRREGLLEAIDEQRPEGGAIRSEITDRGLTWAADPPQPAPARRMDARPLARALGYRVAEAHA